MMRYLSVLAAGLAAATPALVDLEVVLLGATVLLALPDSGGDGRTVQHLSPSQDPRT